MASEHTKVIVFNTTKNMNVYTVLKSSLIKEQNSSLTSYNRVILSERGNVACQLLMFPHHFTKQDTKQPQCNIPRPNSINSLFSRNNTN